jgi:pimeloyl-ACP methyl ester carboxylesterase
MKIETVKGAAGVKLHHGWSQSHLCWSKQYESALKDDARIVALDLRGHGMSDAPAEIDQYTDGDKWADDIAAVNFVAAAVVLGQRAFGTLMGPGFLENAPGACQNDLPTNIAAMRRFLRACFVKPVSEDNFEEILAFNMVVKPHVRSALIRRELDFASLLEGITVPVLVTHGHSDTVVLPAMADYILKHCNSAEPSWYEGVGYAPFLEEPLRFNTELKRFAVNAHP